jgi:putative CocE/NonD family hydrolase
MVRWVVRLAVGLAALAGGAIVLAVAVIVVAGLLYLDPDRALNPAGLPHGASQYLTMRDGTRIAITVWLPEDLKRGERVPALIKATPYWRAGSLSFLGKAAVVLGMQLRLGDPDTPILNRRGYAVIGVDTRGTGASFGHQAIALDTPEVDDYGEIIDWAAGQPWSNGRVGAYGFSYRGMLAVSMASLGRPALKAIAPSFDFTDLYLSTYPGGVLSDTFLRKWGSQTRGLNEGAPPCEGLCRWLASGPRRVDADRDGSLLTAALAQHQLNYDVYACAKRAEFRDDKICSSGESTTDISELARRDGLERAGVPMFVIAGWLDATSPAEVLQRVSTFSNPQQVVVGAISHGGFYDTDPFAPPGADVDPSYRAQIEATADFFDRYLIADGQPGPSSVRYEVLNGGGWRTSAAWPPPGVLPERFYLGEANALASEAPSAPGADAYAVDFTASSGPLSRWQSPVDLSQTGYPDRTVADRKLIVYTSAPLSGDMVIAGDPEADLTLASTAPDGMVIVYLEDVLASGKAVYLTEGLIRLVDRKPGTAPIGADPLHSYLRGDAEPMIAGQAAQIRIALSPIAAVIRRGERLRLAIAGADADNFERLPASGPQTFTIERGGAQPSYVEIQTSPP